MGDEQSPGPGHSPEPWWVAGPDTLAGAAGRGGSRAFSVMARGPAGAITVAAVIFNPREGDDVEECRVDAERIVVCVNACSGIPTEELEASASAPAPASPIPSPEVLSLRDQLAAAEAQILCEKEALLRVTVALTRAAEEEREACARIVENANGVWVNGRPSLSPSSVVRAIRSRTGAPPERSKP